LFPKASLWDPADRAAFDADVRKTLPADFYSAFHLPDHYSRVLMGDLGRVALVTIAAVVLFTLLSVGGLKDGLLALVPVFIATGATLGTLVLLGSSINLMNMVAVPIVLGIGVDGGIHFMARLRELPDRDPSRALLDTGPGVWGSAITTLLGFGSIAYSVTPGLQVMGILVSVGTAAALLSVHFVLPALVRKPSPAKGV
ncbi:MAG TPA: MMPL family transporter, partial [Planctomycetota bacterium]|nr:MMPL family transporter [Planctomycetota bacterium]